MADSDAEQWHMNQNILDKINLELRHSLFQFVREIQEDPKEDHHLFGLIDEMYELLMSSTHVTPNNACEKISNAKSSLFVAELLKIVLSAAPRAIHEGGQLISLLEDLLNMVYTRGDRCGWYEIEQLQSFTIWILLQLDINELQSLARKQSKDLKLLDVKVSDVKQVNELWKLVKNAKKQLKIKNLQLTSIDATVLFPMTTTLGCPVRHHPLGNLDNTPERAPGLPSEDISEASIYTNTLTDLENEISTLEANVLKLNLNDPDHDDDVFEY